MNTASWMTSGEGHPRRWAILGVLVVSLLVVMLDNTVLNIALPTIQEDLDASQSQLVWAVDAYILVFASTLFTWGVIGDRIGRKRVVMIGLSIFGLASLVSAFAESIGMLIGLRAVMGIGGAAVMPTTLAIITIVFPPHERGKAIGTWAGAVGAAVALGPVLGGLLLQHPQWSHWLTQNNWGSVFLINVPIVIVGLIGIARVVPESRNPHPRRFDLTGLVLSAGGLILVVFGIIHAAETRDWLAASVVIPGTIGILVLAVFLWLEARSDHASFDVSLFKNRGYAVTLTAVSFAFFAMSGITFSLPFYLQVLRGMDVLAAGMCFLPFAVGQLLTAPRSARMVARFGYRKVMTTGLVVVGIVLIFLTRMQIDTPLPAILVLFFFYGLGMGSVIAPGSTVLQNVLPLARAGAGSAVQNTVRQVFGALGIAVVGTVLATQYAANLTSALAAAPVKLESAAVTAAQESVVAADVLLDRAAAGGMPATVVAQLRDGAFASFLSAAHATMWICAVVVFAAALVLILLLPHMTPPEVEVTASEAPASVEDALVQGEIANYASEVAGELGGVDRADPQ